MPGTVIRTGLGDMSFNNAGNSLLSSGINIGSGYLLDYLNGIYGDPDSDVAKIFGTTTSSLINSTTNTLANNLSKGNALFQGLGNNIGSSLAGTGVGLASGYIGKGISSAMGNSNVGKGLGAGIGTALGGIGSTVVSNLFKGEKAFSGLFQTSKSALTAAELAKEAGNATKAADIMKAAKFGRNANLFGLAASAVGSGLEAGFGPSKEYGGKYGMGVQIADTAYDAVQTAAGFFGPVGSIVSGVMALNKGLSNVFGSTDGMTVLDAILGSAWMPAPVKWINMINANTTGSFKNQSWLDAERTTAFMLNAFGDLPDKFDKAREEAGKTYGTFSLKAYRRALDNLDYANNVWDKILKMTDLNEILNIRSLYMTSINNQRYAQNIQGGWNPVYRGKQGMKIFNNATNHKIGMRLLSGAALVDSKQMILCGAVD